MGKNEENAFSSTIVLTSRTSSCEKNDTFGRSGKDDEDPYNPLEHRKVDLPNTDLQSIANLLKASLGSGILAMPLAFSNAGILVGTLGTIIVGFICTHCCQILVETSREICTLIRQPCLGYAETCEEAFANGPRCVQKYSKAVRYASDFGMAATGLGACCVYVVLISSSMKQLVEIHHPDVVINMTYYCLMILLPLILVVQIRNLKHLAPFSLCSNIMFVLIVCITLYVIARDLPSIGERKLYTSITTFPSFLSIEYGIIAWGGGTASALDPSGTENTVIFAMEGIGIVMYVENSMATPSHFLGCPGVLNFSMAFVVLLYGLLGFLGYLKYGDDVMGSITLNLDPTALPAKIAKGLIVVAIFFTYTVQFYVAIKIIWKYAKTVIPTEWHNLSNIGVRTLCVILTVCLGAAIPKLDAIISLVGAIFYSTLGLFIPALVQTIFRWDKDLGKWNWILWKNIILMIFAITALVCGVTVTVIDLMKE